MLLKILGGVLLVVLIAYAGWHVYNASQMSALKSKNAAPVDFARLPLVPKPNQAIVLAGGMSVQTQPPVAPPIASPVFTQDAAAVGEALVKIVTAEPRTELLFKSADGTQLTFVQLTNLMRYPDFVSVQLVPREGGGSELAMYSRSIYGYGDAGVNAARVARWLAKLQDALKS